MSDSPTTKVEPDDEHRPDEIPNPLGSVDAGRNASTGQQSASGTGNSDASGTEKSGSESSGEFVPQDGGANAGASSGGGEQEASESGNAGASGDREQEAESAKGGASGGEQESDGSGNRGASGGEQKPKEDTNLASCSTKRILTSNLNLDSSSDIEVPLEGGTSLLPSSIDVKKEEMITDTSKETTGGDVEESSSSFASESITSSERTGDDHICSDSCIHGGARPKTNKKRRSRTNPESPIDPKEYVQRLEHFNRLMERLERGLEQNPPDDNISREEWKEQLGNANCLTEEFSEQLGYRPIVQMPEDTRSPSLQVHGQLERMFMSLSLEDEISETQPCIVSRSALNPQQESSTRPRERNEEEELRGQNLGLASGETGHEGRSNEDDEMVLLRWQIPVNQNEQVEDQASVQEDKKAKVAQEPDPKHQEEKMEVPEDLDDEKMEGVEERDPIHHDQEIGVQERLSGLEQPRQEYRLIRIDPGVDPVFPPPNPIRLINPNPNHPYRLRNLEEWRATMMTAYRSGRYHNSELLDNLSMRLGADGISDQEFYRLYHSTRFMDFYCDEGVDEPRTPSELYDMALENRINQIIMAFGYMTVAMLYMSIHSSLHPVHSTESSDSGNVDTSESEPNVGYTSLREHVNIEIAENPQSDIEQQSSENSMSEMAIDSPVNPSSPQGIQSPDLQAPPNSTESTPSIKYCPLSILLPLSEVSQRSDTSSSHKSLMSDVDMFDIESSSPQPISSPSLPHSSSQSTSACSQFASSSPSHSSSSQAPPSSPLSQSSSPRETSSSSTRESSTSSPSRSSSSPTPSTSQAPLRTRTSAQAFFNTKTVKKDDLKRRAIMRSFRSSSRDSLSLDAPPVRAGEEKVEEGQAGGFGVIQRVGDLVELMVSAIFASMPAVQPQGSGEDSQRQDDSVHQGQSEEYESQKQVEDEKDSDGSQTEIEDEYEQDEGDQEEGGLKKETEAEDEGEKKMEDEAEEENLEEKRVLKTEREDRKRKDHSDSDDEFRHRPKRSHMQK